MTIADDIARSMALYAMQPDVQLVQTQFRLDIAATWQIPPGSRVLELGCGQGDMTAVLAHIVGPEGHVTAIDRADATYGAPVSLEASARHLLATPLGARIDIRFNTDLLDPRHTFAPDSFDYVVLANSSWYVESLDVLRRMLLRVRPWAGRLCYAEWDMQPHSHDQIAHLLAVLIQGQLAVYNETSEANVRTPMAKSRLTALLQESGWTPSAEATVDTSGLQDADWEIDYCLRSAMQEAAELDMPVKLRDLLHTQVDLLRQVAGAGQNRPLPSCTIVAQRSAEAPARA